MDDLLARRNGNMAPSSPHASPPRIGDVQKDDGSFAAYDDNTFDGGDTNAPTLGRGANRVEALNDLVEAYEWTEAGKDFVKQIVFAIAGSR